MITLQIIFYFFLCLFSSWLGTPLLQSKRLMAISENLRAALCGFLFLAFYFLTKDFILWQIFLAVLLVLVLSIWFKGFGRISLLILLLGLFNFGFEGLLSVLSIYVQQLQDYSWLFKLGENYLEGALFGFALGLGLRWLFRINGVAWWLSLCLLLAGIASLGTAWGFVLGDFLMGQWRERSQHKNRIQRLYWIGALVFSFIFLALTTPFESEVLNWMNGEYSIQIRSLQLAMMSAIFLLLQSFWAWLLGKFIARPS